MAVKLVLVGFTAIGIWALPATANAAGDAREGQRIAQHWCASCHVIDQSGRGADAAPAFAALATDPAKSERYLKTWISNPHPPMPNFNLTRRTIDDLVAYILSLSEKKRSTQAK